MKIIKSPVSHTYLGGHLPKSERPANFVECVSLCPLTAFTPRLYKKHERTSFFDNYYLYVWGHKGSIELLESNIKAERSDIVKYNIPEHDNYVLFAKPNNDLKIYDNTYWLDGCISELNKLALADFVDLEQYPELSAYYYDCLYSGFSINFLLEYSYKNKFYNRVRNNAKDYRIFLNDILTCPFSEEYVNNNKEKIGDMIFSQGYNGYSNILSVLNEDALTKVCKVVNDRWEYKKEVINYFIQHDGDTSFPLCVSEFFRKISIINF